ncbi:hypothetical protein LZ32DRAFT_85103 [Colletotrichum eremochloae]|nr:hypothetical protein LZ32DRAFT_85103 [Colletotrichum eremochloae]
MAVRLRVRGRGASSTGLGFPPLIARTDPSRRPDKSLAAAQPLPSCCFLSALGSGRRFRCTINLPIPAPVYSDGNVRPKFPPLPIPSPSQTLTYAVGM